MINLSLWLTYSTCKSAKRKERKPPQQKSNVCQLHSRVLVGMYSVWDSFLLTLCLLMWKIWWALNNASKGQVGFNSAFKVLNMVVKFSWCSVFCIIHTTPHHSYFNHPCNMRSRKLKALSTVHSAYWKTSLKMALQLGRNMLLEL